MNNKKTEKNRRISTTILLTISKVEACRLILYTATPTRFEAKLCYKHIT